MSIRLSQGLIFDHFDEPITQESVCGHDELIRIIAVRATFDALLGDFVKLTGLTPTNLDTLSTAALRPRRPQNWRRRPLTATPSCLS